MSPDKAMMDRQREVTVVIVAYHGPEELCACLESLEGEFDVVVADNSSSRAIRAVAAQYEANYLDMKSNQGFAAGVNAGIAECKGNHDVLLLNPDALISPSEIRRMQELLHETEKMACVGPTTVRAPETDSRGNTLPFPAPIPKLWKLASSHGIGRHPLTDWISGAVLLLNAEAIHDVGGFDTRFFLYWEEVDWQRAAIQAGWGIRKENIDCYHSGGTSTDAVSWRQLAGLVASEQYMRKWFGSLGWQFFRWRVVLRLLRQRRQLDDNTRHELGMYLRQPSRVAQSTGFPPSI